MAALTRDEVVEIARLARLALTDDELDAMAADLGAILDHVAALAEVDTRAVEPMTHAVPLTLRLRDDVPATSLTGDQAVGSAAAVRDGCFVVPAVIKAG